MTISFFVEGLPKAQPRPKAYVRGKHAGVYDPKTANSWKERIHWASKECRPAQPWTGPIELAACFVMPRPKAHHDSKGKVKPGAGTWHTFRPDLDNLEKAVMDVLTQEGFWVDDSQVCYKISGKIYGNPPGVKIKITAKCVLL